MSQIVKKELTNIEVVNIIEWYRIQRDKEKENDVKLNSNFTLKGLIAIRNNMRTLAEFAQTFIETRNDLEEQLRSQFFDDDKSYETTQPQKDADGNDVFENGEPVMVPVRQVKDEYMDEFKVAAEEFQKKLNDAYMDTVEVNVKLISYDDFLFCNDEGKKLTNADLDMISFMIDEDGE